MFNTREYDEEAAEKAIRDLLLAFGEDIEREGIRDTPRRVAKAYREMLRGMHKDPVEHLRTTFEISHQDLVLVKDIPFSSICEHHLLPFIGTAQVAYIPGDKHAVVGISKLARVVDEFAARLQVQERLTNEVAKALEVELEPRGVIVSMRAEHLCMSMRGVNKKGATTCTVVAKGEINESGKRLEVLQLLQ